MKIAPWAVALLSLFFIGCESSQYTVKSKPYGISRNQKAIEGYKKPDKGTVFDHFKKPSKPQEATVEKAPTPEVKRAMASEVGADELLRVRQRYGIPSSEGVRPEDRKALMKIFAIELERLGGK